ncbi:hypothetical protein L1887_29304 [Cichorium endivia]|nr:hypothetical protein L1887_29304 [Cichorium endivia]
MEDTKYDYVTIPVLAEIFKLTVKGCRGESCDSLLSSPIQWYMLGVLSACLSALVGVYTEFLIKKNNDNLYFQNVQLYTFGAIFNMARLFVDDFRGGFEKGAWWERLFNRYTITTWLVALNLGSTGLLVSWLMKFRGEVKCKPQKEAFTNNVTLDKFFSGDDKKIEQASTSANSSG